MNTSIFIMTSFALIFSDSQAERFSKVAKLRSSLRRCHCCHWCHTIRPSKEWRCGNATSESSESSPEKPFESQ